MKITNRFQVGGNAKFDVMTPEEIDEFAEDTYEQIMKLMRCGEDTDAK